MKVTFINEATELERREKLVSLLTNLGVFRQPDSTVYLTFNTRKVRIMAEFFEQLPIKKLILPEIRTLRGFYDSLVNQYFPELKILLPEQKKILIQYLIDHKCDENDRSFLQSIREDLIQFDHYCSLYLLPDNEKQEIIDKALNENAGILSSFYNLVNTYLDEKGLIDYNAIPGKIDFSVLGPNLPKIKYLIFDDFYWLYPYQTKIVQQLLMMAEHVIWMDNPAVGNVGWGSVSERGIPEELAVHLQLENGRKTSNEITSIMKEKLTKEFFTDEPSLQIINCPTIKGEVKHAVHMIKYLIDQRGAHPSHIILTYLSPDYVPYIETEFGNQNIPYNLGRGIQVQHVPVMQMIIRFLGLPLSDFPVTETLSLLKHPIVRATNLTGIRFSGLELKHLEEWCNLLHIKEFNPQILQFQPEEWFADIKTIENPELALPSLWLDEGKLSADSVKIIISAINKLNQLIERYSSQKQMDKDEFLISLKEILDNISSLQSPYQDLQTIHSTNLLNSLYDEFATAVEQLEPESLSWSDWVRMFINLINNRTEPMPYPNGVRCLEKLEARGMTGDYLIVLGGNKHFLPDSIELPGLFKEALKEHIGSHSRIFSSFSEADYLIHQYIFNFRHTVISYPSRVGSEQSGLSPVLYLRLAECLSDDEKTSEEIETLLKKKYIRNMRNLATEISAYENAIIADEEKLTNKLNIDVKNKLIDQRLDRNIKNTGIYAGFVGVDKAWKGLLKKTLHTADSVRWSPTKIDMLAKCPFRFWMRYGLKIRVEETADSPMDTLLIGKIYHLALQNIFRDKDVWQELSSVSDINRLIKLFDYHFEQAIGSVKKIFSPILPYMEFMVNGMLESIRQYEIENLVRYETDRIKKTGKVPEKIETEVPVDQSVRLKSYNIPLVGRIDRIDFFDGEIRFYDYKYSGSTYGYDMKNGLYWQLILYALALEEQYREFQNLYGYIYQLKKNTNGKIGILEDSFFSDFFDNLHKHRSLIMDYLESIISVFEIYHFYPSHLDPAKAHCKHCEFKLVCKRKQFFKNELTALESPLFEASFADADLFPQQHPVKYMPGSLESEEES